MIFAEAVDYGTAPEIAVGAVASVERISPGQVRVSYYSSFRNAEGKLERRIVLHLVWDLDTWLRMGKTFEAARTVMAADPLGKDAGLELPAEH